MRQTQVANPERLQGVRLFIRELYCKLGRNARLDMLEAYTQAMEVLAAVEGGLDAAPEPKIKVAG